MTTETLPMYETTDTTANETLRQLVAGWRTHDGFAAPIYHKCASELEEAMSKTESQPRLKNCPEDGCPWTAKPTIAQRYNYCPICGEKL